jgi:hypothetical protein
MRRRDVIVFWTCLTLWGLCVFLVAVGVGYASRPAPPQAPHPVPVLCVATPWAPCQLPPDH